MKYLLILPFLACTHLLFSQNDPEPVMNMDSLYTEIKKIVFLEGAAARTIKTENLECYPYFTKHLKTKTLSSVGNGLSNFVFIEVECGFYQIDNSCERTYMSTSGCALQVESGFPAKQVFACGKYGGRILKLFGTQYNDFNVFIPILLSITREEKLLEENYFLKNYSIEGYDFRDLIPVKSERVWWR